MALVVTVVSALSHPARAHAGPPPVLSHAQQLALARAYAPTLVFHPQEQYFPTNVMSSVDVIGAIGAWSSRVEQYRRRDTATKLGDAALAYRVFTRIKDDHSKSSSSTGATTCTTRSPSAAAGCRIASTTTTRTTSNVSIFILTAASAHGRTMSATTLGAARVPDRAA